MHIDTNAQNCNFLSEFVRLRGSLSCQWIVRCAAPSLPLPHLVSLSLSASMWVSRKRIPSWQLENGKDHFQNGGKKVWTFMGLFSWKIHFLPIFKSRSHSISSPHGSCFFSEKPRGRRCALMVCFHKQVLFNATEHVGVKRPQPFPVNFSKAHGHVVSPLSVWGFWPNSTCQLTLKCHNHWDVFLCLRCPGSKEERRTMAVSWWTCHRVRLDWHMLGQITGVGDDGGLPSDSQPPAIRNPLKTGSDLGLALLQAPLAQCWYQCKCYWERKIKPWAMDEGQCQLANASALPQHLCPT